MKFTDESQIPTITKEDFGKMIAATRTYTVLILHAGPRYEAPGPGRSSEVTGIITAHAMRNTAMQKAGLMPIVCPIGDGTNTTGIGVFDLTVEETTKVMDGDPAVQAGVLTYELHACFSLPIVAPQATSEGGTQYV
jgi:hypothetical protein